jgi:hypothetical protein
MTHSQNQTLEAVHEAMKAERFQPLRGRSSKELTAMAEYRPELRSVIAEYAKLYLSKLAAKSSTNSWKAKQWTHLSTLTGGLPPVAAATPAPTEQPAALTAKQLKRLTKDEIIALHIAAIS